MSELKFYKRTIFYKPVNNSTGVVSYASNVVNPITSVQPGDLVGLITVRTVAAFNGSGTAAIFELGDGNDPDRFMDGGEVDEETAGSFVRAIGASGGTYILYRNFLYTTADTIDVNFTADTNGDDTTGAMEINIWVAKVRPS